MDDFVETHLCKLCVMRRSRVALGVCPHLRAGTPLITNRGQQGDANQSVHGNYKTRF